MSASEDIDTRAEFSVCTEGHTHVHIEGTALVYPSSLEAIVQTIENLLADPQQFSWLSLPLVVPLTYILSREQALVVMHDLRSKVEIARAITLRKAQAGFEG